MKSLAVRIATALLAAWYALCRLLPVRDQIVCISRQSDQEPVDFRMIRAYFQREWPGWRVVVLANTLKSPLSYLPVMMRQVFYIATSPAVVLDSYCIVVSLLGERIKAPVVQIWHALGNMKKFGYTALDTEEGHSAETAALMHMHEGYDAVAVSSLTFAEDLAAGFNVEPSIVFEAPLPRVDLLLDKGNRAAQRAAVEQACPQPHGQKGHRLLPDFPQSGARQREGRPWRRFCTHRTSPHTPSSTSRHPVTAQV